MSNSKTSFAFINTPSRDEEVIKIIKTIESEITTSLILELIILLVEIFLVPKDGAGPNINLFILAINRDKYWVMKGSNNIHPAIADTKANTAKIVSYVLFVLYKT